MNIRTSAFRGLAILSLSILGLAACDKKEEIVLPETPPAITVTVTPDNLNLTVGQTGSFVAIVNNSTNQTVTWQSSNTAVATVTAAGVVTAVAPGNAVITATSAADGSKKAAANVNVVAAPVQVVTLSVVPSNASLNIGGTVQLVPTVTGTTNTNVTYTSSATNVATVSATGLVTAVAAGTAVITTRSAADATKAATTQITVVPNAPITVTITPSQATTGVNGTVQFVSVVGGSTNQAVTYSSSATGVATITAGGLATGVSAGTAVITATSVADPNARATAVLTVTALPPVTMSVSPTTITNLGAGATTQIVATVTGSTNLNVTCATGNAAIATVAVSATGRGCDVTGVAAGSTVITVTSAADNTVVATVPVTVVGASVAIATTSAAAPPATTAGAFTISANVSVPAGTADSLVLRLTNTTTGTQYNVFCQQFTAAGAATTVVCPINPSDLDGRVAGAQVLPNGTYSVQAILFRGANTAATATFGSQIITANANTVNGVVTFDNTLNDVDNDPANTTATGPAATVWFGGSATVALTSSIYSGNAINTIQVLADQNCNLTADAGEAIRTVTLTNGAGTVTFSEANIRAAATPGIDDLEDASVCFAILNPLDANAAAITLSGAGAGTGNIIGAGTAVNAVFGAGQNSFPIDNVEAGAFVPTLPAWPNSYAGTNSPITTATIGGLAGAVDAGVSAAGGAAVTFRFFAVPSANLPVAPTQAQYAASTTAAGTIEVSNANQMPESTVANNAYTLVVEAKDGLGNVRYAEAGDFGVDLTLPTLTANAATTATNNSINPALELDLRITDTFSGPVSVRARLTVHSVLEADADAGTEIQCIAADNAAPSALPASGVCPTYDVAVVDVAGTTETGAITLPNAAVAEGYIVAEVWSVDRAGNVSTDMVTRTVLMDATAPVGTVDQYTVITATNSISLNGTIRENVDLSSYDIRYNFPGLVTIPTQIPFTAPTMVDSYGLPLTGVLTVTGQNATNIREVREGATISNPNQVGFGAWDVAGNFGYINQALAFGGGGNGTTLAANDAGGANTFDLDPAAGVNTLTMDRSAGPTSGTLSAIVQVGATAANPIAQVYFYYVHPGTDVTTGTADDYLVLLGSTSSSSVITGVTERTYTFTWPVTVTVGSPFPIDAFTYNVVALAVDSQGDALVSDVATVRIQP